MDACIDLPSSKHPRNQTLIRCLSSISQKNCKSQVSARKFLIWYEELLGQDIGHSHAEVSHTEIISRELHVTKEQQIAQPPTLPAPTSKSSPPRQTTTTPRMCTTAPNLAYRSTALSNSALSLRRLFASGLRGGAVGLGSCDLIGSARARYIWRADYFEVNECRRVL